MRSRSALIAAVAAATTLALVVTETTQNGGACLRSLGSSDIPAKLAPSNARSQRPGAIQGFPPSPNDIAALLNTVETALRNPATACRITPRPGASTTGDLSGAFRQPNPVLTSACCTARAMETVWLERHLAARREFLRMGRRRRPTVLPAWRIIAPEPAQNLLTYYQKAEVDHRH